MCAADLYMWDSVSEHDSAAQVKIEMIQLHAAVCAYMRLATVTAVADINAVAGRSVRRVLVEQLQPDRRRGSRSFVRLVRKGRQPTAKASSELAMCRQQ